MNISDRLANLDWGAIRTSLNQRGFVRTTRVLKPQECEELMHLYPRDQLFRSHIIMSRYRFGRGDYKYFKYPLPKIVQELRVRSYPELVPLANEWNRNLGSKEQFPKSHNALLAICGKEGQVRPTPLLLHYEEGDFNCL